jgi:hypothetical protein
MSEPAAAHGEEVKSLDSPEGDPEGLRRPPHAVAIPTGTTRGSRATRRACLSTFGEVEDSNTATGIRTPCHRSFERQVGVDVEPPGELGHRIEAKPASSDDLQLGGDVLAEVVRAHAEHGRDLLGTDSEDGKVRPTRPMAGRFGRGLSGRRRPIRPAASAAKPSGGGSEASQTVTIADLTAGRIRVPRRAKRLFPSERTRVEEAPTRRVIERPGGDHMFGARVVVSARSRVFR